jgi:hypothetical protein
MIFWTFFGFLPFSAAFSFASNGFEVCQREGAEGLQTVFGRKADRGSPSLVRSSSNHRQKSPEISFSLWDL